jgi:hypothetical protein
MMRFLQYVNPEDALVLHSEMGWSDPGTLYALKEAIDPNPEANVTKGLTLVQESSDCLVYNYEDEKLGDCRGVGWYGRGEYGRCLTGRSQGYDPAGEKNGRRP